VPGPVTSSASVGCHVLLRADATLVTRADEVVELVGRAGELAADPARPTSLLDGLGDDERRVYDAFPARGARTVDEIAVGSGLPPTQVLGDTQSASVMQFVRQVLPSSPHRNGVQGTVIAPEHPPELSQVPVVVRMKPVQLSIAHTTPALPL